jgi:small subunit ribosomal protein S3
MGQKVHPNGFRLGVIRDWNSKWYANSSQFSKKLVDDHRIRECVTSSLGSQAFLSRIRIERPANDARITLRTARPGVVIGKKGEDIERLRAKLAKLVGIPVHINLEEVRKPELDARLVAESIAQQIERRVMFRRAMKRAVTSAIRAGAKGIKVCVSGRLGGAEIARTEWSREGRVPLHTLRADIDYGLYHAKTTYGIIGVKVWIFKGEVLGTEEQPVVEERSSGKGGQKK